MIKQLPSGEWGVFHAHAQKKGSKTDKPKGTLIAKHKTKAEALAQHRAIMFSKARRGEINIPGVALSQLRKGGK